MTESAPCQWRLHQPWNEREDMHKMSFKQQIHMLLCTHWGVHVYVCVTCVAIIQWNLLLYRFTFFKCICTICVLSAEHKAVLLRTVFGSFVHAWRTSNYLFGTLGIEWNRTHSLKQLDTSLKQLPDKLQLAKCLGCVCKAGGSNSFSRVLVISE